MPRRKKQPNGQLTDYGTQAVKVPTGGPYGRATELANAQKVVPLADNTIPLDVREARIAQEVEGFNPFAGVTPLDAPSQYPSEPVTTGVAVGPGAGPEVLRSAPRGRVADGLMLLAEVTNDPEIRALAMEAMR